MPKLSGFIKKSQYHQTVSIETPMAERAGFEPALRFCRTNALAGHPLRPLEYLSIFSYA